MKNDNGQQLSLTQALDLLKSRQGKNFKTEDVNLAELERLTGTTQAACFAMICHHCGQRYVEFFPKSYAR